MALRATREKKAASIMQEDLDPVTNQQFLTAAELWEVHTSPLLRVLGNYARYIVKLRYRISKLEEEINKGPTKKLTA